MYVDRWCVEGGCVLHKYVYCVCVWCVCVSSVSCRLEHGVSGCVQCLFVGCVLGPCMM